MDLVFEILKPRPSTHMPKRIHKPLVVSARSLCRIGHLQRQVSDEYTSDRRRFLVFAFEQIDHELASRGVLLGPLCWQPNFRVLLAFFVVLVIPPSRITLLPGQGAICAQSSTENAPYIPGARTSNGRHNGTNIKGLVSGSS